MCIFTEYYRFTTCLAFVGLAFFFGLVRLAYGATAAETLVVANRRMSDSVDIARYYMKKRHIPADHLLVTSLTTAEEMDREQYDEYLKKPVLKKIKALKVQRIAAVVLIYGVPLKVAPPSLDWQAEEKVKELRERRRGLHQHGEIAPDTKDEIQKIVRQIQDLIGEDKRASVDSELSLAKVPDYPLSGWIENPYFLEFRNKKLKIGTNDVLLVCRLDGPDPQTVYRMINDSLAAEKTGLHGIAYFDARWPPVKKGSPQPTGYRFYDESLYQAAKIVAKRMPVKVEGTSKLFPPHSAPRAALYAGWYSLGHYIDSFTWVRGAIGYHIASSECVTLHNPENTGWCVQMLEHGAAATIGPVHEPYVQGFPLPVLFFAALTQGYLNLGESYLISLPYLSWQMVLVGDPLYHPFSPANENTKRGETGAAGDSGGK